MSDGRFFARGKVQEFREDLIDDGRKDPKHSKKRAVLKKIVANMTMGNDMSALFPDVVSCMQIGDLEIKKMVYLYLINYAKVKPDLIILAINSFLKDAFDSNPLIRALSIRTMSYIDVDKVTECLTEPLRRCIKDQDAYVRKTAAIAIVKLYFTDRKLCMNEGMLDDLRSLLRDTNPTVLANAIAGLIEIHEKSADFVFDIDINIASNLVTALSECSEWCQAYIIEALMFFVPQEVGDAEGIIDRLTPRLQHANSAVALTAVKVIMYLINYVRDGETVLTAYRKLAPPLVTLVSSAPEIQYVALRNILLIIQKRPDILQGDMKVFFCKYNDPIYVKLSKLEIMFRLATDLNVDVMLAELKEYATEVDVDFVRKSVRAIGRCAIKVESSADKCVQTLVELIQTKVNYVVQEAIIVIKDIFRKYPNRYESVIGTLCENLDNLDEPEAKASMIWIIGQYADRIENSPELIETFSENFVEDAQEVQLSTITAVVKLFLKRPNETKELLPKVLKMATEGIDNPDVRDRGYFYWRLLSGNPGSAKQIILSDQPQISTETDNLEPLILQDLLLHIDTLASIYHRPARILIPAAKHRKLYESPVFALDRQQQQQLQSAQQGQQRNGQIQTVSSSNIGDGGGYNPYSNDVNVQISQQKRQQQFANLLDLDDDYTAPQPSTDIPASFATIQPQQTVSVVGNGSLISDINGTGEQSSTTDGNIASALASLSFNNVPATGSMITPFSAPKEMLLPANQGKGLEITGTFSRQNGQILFNLSVTNRALQPFGDFAIQFNKNTFGLLPNGPLHIRTPLPPNQSADTQLVLITNPLTHTQPTSPVNQLQVAIKNSVGVFFFKCNYLLHILFREDGKVVQNEFLALWKNWTDVVPGGQLTFTELQIPNVDQLRQKLLINNIFTVAERDLQTKVNIYVSAKLQDLTPFLVEIQASINADGSVPLVAINAKSSVPGLVPIFCESLGAILKH